VTEQRAHLFQIVMLIEHLHRHGVPEIVRCGLSSGTPISRPYVLPSRQMFLPWIDITRRSGGKLDGKRNEHVGTLMMTLTVPIRRRR
jgi:hypothetical protein